VTSALGIDAEQDVWEGMVHGLLGGIGRLAASTEAFDLIWSFLTSPSTTPQLNATETTLEKCFPFTKMPGIFSGLKCCRTGLFSAGACDAVGNKQ